MALYTTDYCNLYPSEMTALLAENERLEIALRYYKGLARELTIKNQKLRAKLTDISSLIEDTDTLAYESQELLKGNIDFDF